MKTIFTLLLSTIFSLASMAYDGTRLTVTSVSNNNVFVEIDGRRYDLDGNTLSLNNIRPGTHNVRVLREMKRKKRGLRLLIFKNLMSSSNMKIPSLLLAPTLNSSTKALELVIV